MKKFFSYFLGKGERVEFTNFTLAHFAPIILTLALIFIYSDTVKKYALGSMRKQYAGCLLSHDNFGNVILLASYQHSLT